MTVMSLRNLHPDLKLGLVLVSAAVLLKIVGWTTFAFERYAPLGSSTTWLILPTVIGGLAVIPVAIWVDRRPPHKMMAGGAVAAAVGLSILFLPSSLALAGVGIFVSIVGASTTGSLVFYAVVVKGFTRYRGTLIGALGMVIALLPSDRIFRDWSNDLPTMVLGIGVALTLAGGVILIRLLPRVFTYSYGPGPTLLRELAVPKVRGAVMGVTATYLTAYMGMVSIVTASYFIPNATVMSTSGIDSVWSPRQAMTVSIAVGVLLWGIAADFYPVRRLIFVAGLLLLAAAGALAAIDSFATSVAGVFALGLVRGGLLCLPWVLMAELLPTRHFAKIAVGITVILAPLSWMLVQVLLGALADDSVTNAYFWFIPILGIALAFVASRLPGPLEEARVSPLR